jgi:hypothetical protein
MYLYYFNFYFEDIPETVTTIDIHSLPASPSAINRREHKQRHHHHSPICEFNVISNRYQYLRNISDDVIISSVVQQKKKKTMDE